MFLFENLTDDFLVKKEISLIKIRNETPNEGSSSSGNNNSEGLSRGGKKPVLRSMTSLPLKGSEKSLHCHHHHHKDKHCHGKKKHIVHQHIPSKPKGKNTIRLLRALRMKDPDDPEQNPSDMPSDEPHHSDNEEELCDDDDDDDEICDDEEEEKHQKEKEREEMENKHDQIDSGRKRQHKRKVRKNKNKSKPRGSGKHFSEKICGPCKNINMEDLE